MVPSDLQELGLRRARANDYTFIYWQKSMGKTFVSLYFLIERSLDLRSSRNIYIYTHEYDLNFALYYALRVLDKSFKMTCQPSFDCLRFGNGSCIEIKAVDYFLISPLKYDTIVIEDSHNLDCGDSKYYTLMERAEKSISGRTKVGRIVETRLKP